MTAIDPTARIEPGAVIGQDVSIGPYCVIGPNVVIGDGCRLVAHVQSTGHTTIGPRTTVYPFASLGNAATVREVSRRRRRGWSIGADCEIREGVTMNTGTEDGGGVTEVGDRCCLMVGSHVGARLPRRQRRNLRQQRGARRPCDGRRFRGLRRPGRGASVRAHRRRRNGGRPERRCAPTSFRSALSRARSPIWSASMSSACGDAVPAKRDIHRLRRAYQALFFGAGHISRAARTGRGGQRRRPDRRQGHRLHPLRHATH